MKIAILAEGLNFGGIARYCLTLVERLGRHPDVEPVLLAMPSKGDDWLLREADRLGVAVEVLSDVPVRALRRQAAERGLDVLHTNGYRGNIISRAALCGHGSRPKAVCTVHGAHYFSSAARRSRCYYALDYLTMFRADKVIAVSAATARQVSRWARGDRLVVIHNGTTVPDLPAGTAKAAQREALGIPAGVKVVCFMGRFDPQKGVGALAKTMTEALAVSDDVVFLLVGDGRSRAQVEAVAARAKGRVIMTGRQREVDPFFTASDLVFFPSNTEGLPMALLEAFAHGLPAVASDVGGMPEVISDGDNGFLCERDDTAAMTGRILDLTRDDALRAAMGARARSTVLAGFTDTHMVEATLRLYRSLAG